MGSAHPLQETLTKMRRYFGVGAHSELSQYSSFNFSKIESDIFRVVVLGKKSYQQFYIHICDYSLPYPGLVIESQSDKALGSLVSTEYLPVWHSKMNASEISSDLVNLLGFSPYYSDWIHGSLVAVDGTGVLLLGPPGIGKSRLVQRLLADGHRMVADDVVECDHLSAPKFTGRPALTQYGMFARRGSSIIDVVDCYGEQSLCYSASIDLSVVLRQDVEYEYPDVPNWNDLPMLVDVAGVDSIYQAVSAMRKNANTDLPTAVSIQ